MEGDIGFMIIILFISFYFRTLYNDQIVDGVFYVL